MEALSFYVLIIGIFFKGNNTYPSSYLNKIYNLKGIDTLYSVYFNKGFFDITILSSGDTIIIKEGERYKFGRINLDGNYFFSSKHIQDILPPLDAPFNADSIQYSIKGIMELYQNNGFPFVSVKIKRFLTEDKTVGFNLEIFEGPRCKIDGITFKNKGITKVSTIEKFLRLKKGVYFSKEDFKKKLNRLNDISFIKIKGYTLQYKEEGKINIILDNQEYKSSEASGVLAYKKDEVFTGFLSFGTRNLFGTGRGLMVRWERFNKNKTQGWIKYFEPYLLNLPLNLYITVSQTIFDTTYAESNIGGDIKFFSYPFYTRLGIGGKEIILPQKKQHERRYFFSSELGLNSLNPMEMPKKGIMISGKRLWENTGIKSLQANLHLTIPMKHFFSIYLKSQYQEVIGNNLNIGDSISVGGADFLRGYAPCSFFTDEVSLSTAGIRIFSGAFCFYPFFDYGRLIPSGKNLYSAGFGISYHRTKITFAMHNKDIMEGRIFLAVNTAL